MPGVGDGVHLAAVGSHPIAVGETRKASEAAGAIGAHRRGVGWGRAPSSAGTAVGHVGAREDASPPAERRWRSAQQGADPAGTHLVRGAHPSTGAAVGCVGSRVDAARTAACEQTTIDHATSEETHLTSGARPAAGTAVAGRAGEVGLAAVGRVGITVKVSSVARGDLAHPREALSRGVGRTARTFTSTAMDRVDTDIDLTPVLHAPVAVSAIGVAHRATRPCDAPRRRSRAHRTGTPTCPTVGGGGLDVGLTAVGRVAVAISPTRIAGGHGANATLAHGAGVGEATLAPATTAVADVRREGGLAPVQRGAVAVFKAFVAAREASPRGRIAGGRGPHANRAGSVAATAVVDASKIGLATVGDESVAVAPRVHAGADRTASPLADGGCVGDRANPPAGTAVGPVALRVDAGPSATCATVGAWARR
jgi:hypothetical protein